MTKLSVPDKPLSFAKFLDQQQSESGTRSIFRRFGEIVNSLNVNLSWQSAQSVSQVVGWAPPRTHRSLCALPT